MRSTGLSVAEAEGLTRDAVVVWCTNHPGYVVVVSSFGARPSFAELLSFACRKFGQVYFLNMRALCASSHHQWYTCFPWEGNRFECQEAVS